MKSVQFKKKDTDHVLFILNAAPILYPSPVLFSPWGLVPSAHNINTRAVGQGHHNAQFIAGMLMTRKVTPSTKMLLQMMIKLQCAHQSTFRTHASFRMSISLKTTVDTFVMMSRHM